METVCGNVTVRGAAGVTRVRCGGAKARFYYRSPRARCRPIGSDSSGRAAFMNAHAREMVSAPAPVYSGLRMLNQFQNYKMPTNRNP